ncbi:hypothetical protein QJS04_geneDACA014945 [Acorus gramineus]|uniref:CASP-like protein n=1 Tax=Acorus gramineus TaxID=55184 RepID=A0AAV9BUT3_ACOGR|nr:hypothetical protein QJS04_geneDACA014945 [Acorus gramineus]
MAVENGEKPGQAPAPTSNGRLRGRLFASLRMVSMFATISAALTMGLNKETIIIPVAIVGTNPINVSITAKFSHTPSFIYFVIANAIASFYNFVVLLVIRFVRRKELGLLIPLLDMAMVTLVATGAAAATAVAEVGRNGNSHARWNKICDRFDAYCDRGGGALVASFVGLILLMTLNALSTTTLYKNTSK